MKRILIAAMLALVAMPTISAPVSVRVVSIPRVSVAPMTIKSVAPIKAAPISAVKAPTPIKAAAPVITPASKTTIKPTVAPANKLATPIVAGTTATTAAVVATSANANSSQKTEEVKHYPPRRPVGEYANTTSNTLLSLAMFSAVAMAWDNYTDQEVEAVNADGSRAVMNVMPMFTVLCDQQQYDRAMQWREKCREHGQINTSYCTVVSVNRFCDPATPEDVAGKRRSATYQNVFFK